MSKNQRNKNRYPALIPHLNLKARYEEIADLDYINKLSPDEKAWMNEFMEGYVNASRKSKLFTKREDWKKNEDRNNSRNRCIMTKAKSQGKLVYFSGLSRGEAYDPDHVDNVISGINKKNGKKKFT